MGLTIKRINRAISDWREGEQAVAGTWATERGYRDYMRAGMTARNPYPITERLKRECWQRGFNKAKMEHSR